jgi:hypothetical protein
MRPSGESGSARCSSINSKPESLQFADIVSFANINHRCIVNDVTIVVTAAPLTRNRVVQVSVSDPLMVTVCLREVHG